MTSLREYSRNKSVMILTLSFGLYYGGSISLDPQLDVVATQIYPSAHLFIAAKLLGACFSPIIVGKIVDKTKKYKLSLLILGGSVIVL